MSLPNFGRKCLDEIQDTISQFGCSLTGSDSLGVGTQANHSFLKDPAPLSCLLEVRELVSTGALPELLMAQGWHSMCDLALHEVDALGALAGLPVDEKQRFERAIEALSLRLPLELPTWFVRNADTLRMAFQVELEEIWCSLLQLEPTIPQLARSLNEELFQLIPESYGSIKRKIVSDLLGFAGNEPLTLEQVGGAQAKPLTRERVRQIAQPVTDVLEQRGRDLPWLLKAVATLEQVAPCTVGMAEQSLVSDKILNSSLKISAILRLARRSGLAPGLFLEGEALLTPELQDLMANVMSAAVKVSSHWGAGDWDEIGKLVPLQVRSAVKAQLQEAVWLDKEERYFVLPCRENSLSNRLTRILKVTPRLLLADAYQGAFRDVRIEKERLPEHLFRSFCSIWPWCSVEGDEVLAKSGLPPSAASGDDLLVLVLREIGYPMRRRELTERALEMGLSVETVTHALSYSNVIASANGYFGIIGDPRLEEFGDGTATPPPDILEMACALEKDGLVPDTTGGRFAGPLMLAVQERCATLGLVAPWSVSELRLSQRDRDRLVAWGQSAEWDFRSDFGNYETTNGEKVQKRTALGLAFLLFASEAVRRFADSRSIWCAIENALGERQQKLLMVRAGVPKVRVRDAVEAACRTFGLRHGFADGGQQVWVRTVGLQLGLQCSYLPELGAMLADPADMLPVALQLLLDTEGPNASASFRASWSLLQDVRRGVVNKKTALESFVADAWLSPFPESELLAHCLATESRHKHATDSMSLATAEAYQYFSAPVLRWAVDDIYLEFSLNEVAPPWHESTALVFLCEDPFRRERMPVVDDCWQLTGGPLCVPLTRRKEACFHFKLMQGKEEVFANWMRTGLSSNTLFTFFRASGAMVNSVEDVPAGEAVMLLHSADIQVAGLDVPPIFRVVLCGKYRVVRLPEGALARIQLTDTDGTALWSLPALIDVTAGKAEISLSVSGGKWGTAVRVTDPDIPFTADRLRINTGEVLPITREDEYAFVRMCPSLGRAQIALLQGSDGTHRRSTRVQLQHVGTDFGAALEVDGSWRPLDGSETLDAATLRTQRILAKTKWPAGPGQDICWMEGSRTLATLSDVGTSLAGVQGLGESLNIVRGTYNGSETEVSVARSVTDGGFWRSVQLEADGSWSAHLPFEGPLEEGHALWMWATNSPLPCEFPRHRLAKSGFTLQWKAPTDATVFGWAFSFGGARVGSSIQIEKVGELTRQLAAAPWQDAATWLRWWHAPVLHTEFRELLSNRVQAFPVETLKAWLLPRPEISGLQFDELRDEAWAAAARDLLWGWRPDDEAAVQLVKALGIWTGNIERDSQRMPSLEAVGLLARMSPILLADVIMKSLPAMHPYPKPHLAVLLGRVLETINPNAAESAFRLDLVCERYAKGERRLDGRFIQTSLIGAARARVRGNLQDEHNLRIAFYQSGLRELISIALLRDIFERWQTGAEN
jgi:hypothetical protein